VLGNARDSANTAEKSSHDAIEAAASAKVTASRSRDYADDMKDKAAEQVTAAKEAEELKEKETEALKNIKAESERITASLSAENFEKANKKYYKGVLKQADDEMKRKEAEKEIEDEKALKEVTKIEGMRNKIEKEWLENEAKKKAAADHEEQDRIEARRIKELRDW
jgi:excinuclease UvrABC ATPase subunit